MMTLNSINIFTQYNIDLNDDIIILSSLITSSEFREGIWQLNHLLFGILYFFFIINYLDIKYNVEVVREVTNITNALGWQKLYHFKG